MNDLLGLTLIELTETLRARKASPVARGRRCPPRRVP